jgi:hypothetical protein
LCSNANDAEMDQCVLDFLKSGYNDAQGEPENASDEVCINDDGEDESECLVNNLYNMWADDLPTSSSTAAARAEPDLLPKANIRPWSSRSSPSGTFVRDPVTGKMRNIDA